MRSDCTGIHTQPGHAHEYNVHLHVYCIAYVCIDVHVLCVCVCVCVCVSLQDNQFLNLLISLLVDGEYTGKILHTFYILLCMCMNSVHVCNVHCTSLFPHLPLSPFLYTGPPLSLSHTHTHTLSLSHSLSHTHALSLTHTLSHTLSLTHPLSHTLSLTHTLSHTLSLTLFHRHRCSSSGSNQDCHRSRSNHDRIHCST